MGFSGYDKNHPCYNATNLKVLGKLKDEMDGKIITYFVALRPKMYCLKISKEKKEEKKAKSVPKLKVKRDFEMTDYLATLHEHIPKNVNFNAIGSKNHQIFSINQSKVGLTSYFMTTRDTGWMTLSVCLTGITLFQNINDNI